MENAQKQYPRLADTTYLHVEDDGTWIKETAQLLELFGSRPVLTAACEADLIAILADPARKILLSTIAYVLCNGDLLHGEFGPDLFPVIRRNIPVGVPIIGHSGFDGRIFMEAGANAFTSKADSPDEFFSVINNTLA